MLLLLLLGALLVLYYLLWKPLLYWQERDIPCESPLSLLKNFGKTFLGIRKESIFHEVLHYYKLFPGKRFYGVHLNYNRPVLVIRDPELLKEITVKNFDNFVDHSNVFFGTEVDTLLATNLFSLKGKAWRDMRTTLSPAYTGTKMKAMYPFVHEIGDQLLNYLYDKMERQNTEQIEVEVKDLFTRVTNDVIATCAFGVNCDSLKDRNNEFLAVAQQSTNLETLRYYFSQLVPNIMKLFTSYVLPKHVHTFLNQVVKETLKVRKEHEIIRPDMINLLMQAQDGTLSQEDGQTSDVNKSINSKQLITTEDIVAQVFVFLFAGFETTSTALCFMSHELATNPHIQEKLQNEIDKTLAEADGKVTYETIHSIKYLDMVISESLRKWTPANFTDRHCTKNYTFNDGEKSVRIEKGTTLLVPIIGYHRDPNYFPDPDKFDPERFNSENKSHIKPFTYMPFGNGPRICIGNRFALMELKLTMVKLLSNFDLVTTNKTDVQMELKPIFSQLTAKNGFWIGFRRRSNSKICRE